MPKPIAKYFACRGGLFSADFTNQIFSQYWTCISQSIQQLSEADKKQNFANFNSCLELFVWNIASCQFLVKQKKLKSFCYRPNVGLFHSPDRQGHCLGNFLDLGHTHSVVGNLTSSVSQTFSKCQPPRGCEKDIMHTVCGRKCVENSLCSLELVKWFLEYITLDSWPT
jgi:hypothetical protein